MSVVLVAAMAATTAPRVDHTDDIAIVAQFLSEVRSGKADGSGIKVVNYQDPSRANFPAFVTYANACQIAALSAVASATHHLPVAAKWECGVLTKAQGKLDWEERSAGFWVKDGRVVKLTFDKGPTIVLKAKTNG